MAGLPSWPPSPSTTRFVLHTRSSLLLVNSVGAILCFTAASKEGKPAFYIPGGIMAFSLSIYLPVFLTWTIRPLYRRGMHSGGPGVGKESRGTKGVVSHGYTSFSNAGGPQQPAFGVEMLILALLLDILGFLAYAAVYPFMVRDATHTSHGFWRHRVGYTYNFLMAYASVAVLICVVVHAILVVVQALLLGAVVKAKRALRGICPTCGGNGAGVAFGPGARGQNGREEERGLLYSDGDEDGEVVDTRVVETASVSGQVAGAGK